MESTRQWAGLRPVSCPALSLHYTTRSHLFRCGIPQMGVYHCCGPGETHHRKLPPPWLRRLWPGTARGRASLAPATIAGPPRRVAVSKIFVVNNISDGSPGMAVMSEEVARCPQCGTIKGGAPAALDALYGEVARLRQLAEWLAPMRSRSAPCTRPGPARRRCGVRSGFSRRRSPGYAAGS